MPEGPAGQHLQEGEDDAEEQADDLEDQTRLVRLDRLVLDGRRLRALELEVLELEDDLRRHRQQRQPEAGEDDLVTVELGARELDHDEQHHDHAQGDGQVRVPVELVFLRCDLHGLARGTTRDVLGAHRKRLISSD